MDRIIDQTLKLYAVSMILGVSYIGLKALMVLNSGGAL